jgi:hypothetical protein
MCSYDDDSDSNNAAKTRPNSRTNYNNKPINNNSNATMMRTSAATFGLRKVVRSDLLQWRFDIL